MTPAIARILAKQKPVEPEPVALVRVYGELVNAYKDASDGQIRFYDLVAQHYVLAHDWGVLTAGQRRYIASVKHGAHCWCRRCVRAFPRSPRSA